MPKRGQFQQAAAETPSISEIYRPGVQALKAADKNRLQDKELATGSIDLDDALAATLPNANRWDYGIGLPNGKDGEKVLWLEVHHAASGEAQTVLRKLAWLKAWLRKTAPRLDKLPKTFVWLLSNVENNPNDRKRRNQLAEKHGLRRMQGILSLSAFSNK